MNDKLIIPSKRFYINTPEGRFKVETLQKPASSFGYITKRYKFKKIVRDRYGRPVHVILSVISNITNTSILGDEVLYIVQEPKLINKHLS